MLGIGTQKQGEGRINKTIVGNRENRKEDAEEMKISNKSKFISVLIGAAMCPMVLPTAAFAAGAGAASGVSSSPAQLIQSSESEGADTGASSGDMLAAQSESTGEAANATTGKAANEVAAPAAETGGEGTTAAVAEVGGKSYSSLQEAINKAQGGETVTLLTDAIEDVAITKTWPSTRVSPSIWAAKR